MIDFAFFVLIFILSAPGWLPIAFAAYWIGRKKFSILSLFVLIFCEAVAIEITLQMKGLVYWLLLEK